jgi:IS30 family transposase
MGQDNHTTGRGKWKQLSEKERYKIEVLLKAGHKPSEIARMLGRHRRTIEREIRRGSIVLRRENPYASRNPAVKDFFDEEVYAADVGQRRAMENAANKGRGLKIGHDHELARHLEKRIGEDAFSPDAAIGEIKDKGLTFKVTLCTKTVYNMIDRGDFLNLSNKDLPVKRNKKKGKYRKVKKVALNNLKGRSIEERPAVVNDREEFGHWEMDLVVGSGKACLLVMTERVSRRELICKIPDKRQQSVKEALDKLERKHRGQFSKRFKSFTMDNGNEFIDSKSLEASCLRQGESRTICYYAHPYSAWERGSNENANKLIRRFVPKGTDIGKLSARDIKRIQQWMNNYPRRMFGYKTANDIYMAA